MNDVSILNGKTILIVGFGDIAQRLSESLAHENVRFFGIKRHPIEVNNNKLSMIYADIARMNEQDYIALSELPKHIDLVLYTLSPSDYSEQGYYQAYVKTTENMQQFFKDNGIKTEHCFFISSTGVYGQNQHEIVNEESQTKPQSFSGKMLLEAEQNILRLNQENNDEHYYSLRLSGIYGRNEENRYLSMARENRLYNEDPKHYTNRIHIEDIISTLRFLFKAALQNKFLKSIILVSDSEPETIYNIQQWLIKKHDINIDKSSIDTLSLSRNVGSKRCDNSYLISLGYKFIHENFKSGFNS